MGTLTELNCWGLIYGTDMARVFRITISMTKTVADLKEFIVKDLPNTFRDVDASVLHLYSTTLPDDQDLDSDAIGQWTMEDKPRLEPLQKLSNLNLSSSSLIIVLAPNHSLRSTDMRLNCWLRGEDITRTFSVKISSKMTVGVLRDLIKNEKSVDLHDVEANALLLYKVGIPCASGDDLRLLLDFLTFDEFDEHFHFLQPSCTLSKVSPGFLPEQYAHIVIEVPSISLERLAFLNYYRSNHPSIGSLMIIFSEDLYPPGQDIFWDCPRATVPLALLHEVFGQFLDDCETHEITTADESLSEELRVAMMNRYPDKSTRTETIHQIFSKWDVCFTPTTISDRYDTDGAISLNGHCYVIAASESYHQAIFHYLEATKKYAINMRYSPLPCIIILLFGPYIRFAGAAWNFNPRIERLLPNLSMHYDLTDTEMRTKVARHLGAFKKAVRTLEEHYQGLLEGVPLRSIVTKPHPFSYCAHLRKFSHVTQPCEQKLLFFGALANGHPICIKFVRRYSREAHLMCATLGCAPTLHGFEELPGGWFMVIMDRLSECKYHLLSKPTAPLIDNIRDVLKQLHQSNYVHGDLRDINIMVPNSDETKFMLIDFDWAGKIGEVRYPRRVNRSKDLWRPDGAVDGALILADHDMDMLNHISVCARE